MGLTLTSAKKQILNTLEGDPKHGYVLGKEMGVRGSTIYEHLGQLEEHGYIEGEEDGRRRVYSLTRRGELILEAERQGGD
jgi:DNA-binding PadR family transcriptional regulator